MNQDDKQPADWLAVAMRQNAFTSLAEFGRMAATIFRGAREEGLDAEEAKSVTEATVTAVLRSVREGQQNS
jgi:hypothetical protein